MLFNKGYPRKGAALRSFLTGVSIFALSAAGAVAQDASEQVTEEDEDLALDAITVTGIRSSLASGALADWSKAMRATSSIHFQNRFIRRSLKG